MKRVLFLLFVTCIFGVSGLAAQTQSYEPYFAKYPFLVLLDDKVVMVASELPNLELPPDVEYKQNDSPVSAVRKLPGLTKYSTTTFNHVLSVTPEFIEWTGQEKLEKKTLKVCIMQDNPKDNLYFLLPDAFVSKATRDDKNVPVLGTVQWSYMVISSGPITATTGNLTRTTTPATTTPTVAPATVTTQPTASTAPFIAGKTLRWQTNANGSQKGSAVVTSTKGNYFYLDQTNQKNAAAGVTKLEGEFKDGKVYIYNKKWNETWIGTLNNGVVTGKINRSIDFKIFE